jgi:hypothetical protein
MRKIEASPWMGSADLISTSKDSGNDSRTPYDFELVVHMGKPVPANGSSTGSTVDAGQSAGGAAPASSGNRRAAQ